MVSPNMASWRNLHCITRTLGETMGENGHKMPIISRFNYPNRGYKRVRESKNIKIES